ncbi:outer membrane lipoprotein carrier protein LolA [Shewanella subflava]|uniref:Outer membrane lipoprotein carrier protein LolA n=1 Tax=Shewanella subflava TaxID=2986476 RepID=A0ABT3I9J5_9GAMM|nr:outer membrane lipoprotein carrier protein LolA [Shewanella subflava]MCW3172727.1 outer membrane lipoprotein carrier protein LolA [Shewanella subflava]
MNKPNRITRWINTLIVIMQCGLLVLFLLLLLSQFSSSQAAEVTPQQTTVTSKHEALSPPASLAIVFNHPASEQDLQQLANQVSLTHENTQGLFEQTRYLAALKRPLTSRGTFAFNPNLGMVWHQQAPFVTTMVMHKQQLTTIDSKGNITHSAAKSAQAANPLMQQVPELMQHLLSGDVIALQDDFSMFYLASNTNNTELWSLGLVAKDPLLLKALGKLIIEGRQQINRIVMLNQASTQQADRLDITDIQFKQVNHLPLSAENAAWFDMLNITPAPPITTENSRSVTTKQ